MNISLFNTTQFELSDEFAYTLWQKILFSFFIFPIIFLSIFGNILVVVAVIKYPNLRLTNNIFLASLAVADCAVGILAMPPNALQLLSGHWYLKSFMCRFWFSCDVLFSTASILHLCCVSIDRYLSISETYLFNYIAEDPTKSWRVRIMIASVWITSSVVSFIPIFTNLYTTSEQAAIIDSLDFQNGQCHFVVNLPYRFISSTVSFWLPGIGLVICYSLVMKKAYHLENHEFKKYKSIKRQSSTDRNSQKLTDSIIFTGTILIDSDAKRNSTQEAKIWRREFRLIKTLGIVITVFCLCWIFFFLRYTLCGTTYNMCPESIAKSIVLEDILFWVGYFNSMINPFLYNFTNQDFRRSFKDLLNLNNSKNRKRAYQVQQGSNETKKNKRKFFCFNFSIFKRSKRRSESNASSANSCKATWEEVRKFI